MCIQLKEDKNVFSVSVQWKTRERRRAANDVASAETFRPIRSLATSSHARAQFSFSQVCWCRDPVFFVVRLIQFTAV